MLLVCEPECEGYEHVEFNAALLSAVRAAFAEPVLFLAEPAHLGLVARRAADVRLTGIAWRPIAVPPRRLSGLARVLPDVRVHSEALRLAQARGGQSVLFTSTGTASLFALKLLAAGSRVSCTVVPHGVLDSLEGGGESWFPHVLRMPNPRGLRYLFLSPSIEREVLAASTSLEGATASVEHPYLFSEPAPHHPSVHPVRFASIGTAARDKGLDNLIALARATLSVRAGKAAFAHVGPVRDVELAEGARDVVSFPAARGFLDRPAFEHEIAVADYALFLHPPRSCRFSVSGAFLDAVSLLKPVIALRNPYFEHCFEVMGDIGYLCDTPEQVQALVRDLCARFPKSHYLSQCEELRRGREAFSPVSVGAALRAALGGWEALRAA